MYPLYLSLETSPSHETKSMIWRDHGQCILVVDDVWHTLAVMCMLVIVVLSQKRHVSQLSTTHCTLSFSLKIPEIFGEMH